MIYVELGEEKVPCVIKKSQRTHRMGLYFAATASPVLTIESPNGKLGPEVQSFVQKKTNWILKHYKKRVEMSRKKACFFDELEQGIILYKGEKKRLVFEVSSNRSIRVGEDEITILHKPLDLEAGKNSLLATALRASSGNFLRQRTRHLASYTQSDINTIRIKDQNSRWGSCSSKKNINLNWHLIFLEPRLIDYVIIHELMHLREMNHSPRFWGEVARYCPDYKKLDKAVDQGLWLIGILREEV